ncbi:MAG: hypothetical protein ACREF4_09995, partial [Gammaproteobacteria bacterium]
RELGQLQRQSIELMKQMVVERQRPAEPTGGTPLGTGLRVDPMESMSASQAHLPESMADLEVQELNDATLDVLFARWMEARTEPIRERLKEHGDIVVNVGQIAREAEADAQREALGTSEKVLGIEITLRRHAEEHAEQMRRELELVSAELARESAAARQALQELDRREALLGAAENQVREAQAEVGRAMRFAKQEERARKELETLCEDARHALGSNEAFVAELQAELAAVRAESRGRADQLAVQELARETLEQEIRTTTIEYEATKLRLQEAKMATHELESWSQDMQRAYAGKVAALGTAEEVLRETRTERESLRAAAQEAEEARVRANKEAEARRLAFEAKLIVASQLERALEGEKGATAEARLRVAALEARRADAEDRRDAVARESASQRKQIRELEEALAGAERKAREGVDRVTALEREQDHLKAEREDVGAASAAFMVMLGIPQGPEPNPAEPNPPRAIEVAPPSTAAPPPPEAKPAGAPSGGSATTMLERAGAHLGRDSARLLRWVRKPGSHEPTPPRET